MADLRIGGFIRDRDLALQHAQHYLTDGHGWAYPSYDGYDVGRAAGPLVDTDLLAPLLLNVNRISIRTYERLIEALPQLQDGLDRIPTDWPLADAGAEDLDRLGVLFGVLDGAGIKGVRATTLSKLLHRKRPGFIPLWDQNVRRVYIGEADLQIRPVKGRSWQQLMPIFATKVQDDLKRESAFWDQIVSLAPGPAITPLRALDIVAWWAGKQTIGN